MPRKQNQGGFFAHELMHMVQPKRMNFADRTIQRKFENLSLGGEVMNDTDIPWLIRVKSNSNADDFIFLPPGKNTDELFKVEKKLKGDVDAV